MLLTTWQEDTPPDGREVLLKVIKNGAWYLIPCFDITSEDIAPYVPHLSDMGVGIVGQGERVKILHGKYSKAEILASLNELMKTAVSGAASADG